ncbi:hypothetical protein Tco_1308525, partial [Tanacetum coccineum]
MLSPRTIREVQSLNEKLAALGRFLASHKAEEAFQKLKLHSQSLPALTMLIPEETLTLYLAASHETISFVLMVEREAVKGQLITDFLVDCPNNTRHGEPRKKTTTAPKTHNQMSVWTLYTDGTSGNEGARADLILTDPERNEIT